MEFVKTEGDGLVVCKNCIYTNVGTYNGLVLATPTKPLGYMTSLSNIFVNANSQDLIRLWPHRVYSKKHYVQTEWLLEKELKERGFILSSPDKLGKWIKVYGHTYRFRDLKMFETFVLLNEFDHLDVALNNGPYKLYVKTGRIKCNQCLPEENRIGSGEEFRIPEDTQVIYFKKKV